MIQWQPAVDSFYRYSTDPALAQYSLAFTDLGAGQWKLCT